MASKEAGSQESILQSELGMQMKGAKLTAVGMRCEGLPAVSTHKSAGSATLLSPTAASLLKGQDASGLRGGNGLCS